MEVDINSDDLFVVIIGDGDEEDVKIDTTDLSQYENVVIKKEEVLDEATGTMGVEDIFHTVEMHGEFLEMDIKQVIKEEPEDVEYLEDFLRQADDEDYLPHPNEDENDDDEEYLEKPVRKQIKKGSKSKSDGRRFKMLKQDEQKSFVHDLKQQYPDLKKDQDLLIDTLAEIMRAVKPPEPPPDFYLIKNNSFECVECNRVTDTVPAASRHYQEYHGPRYLFCYACGVDFRSKTNLYKHEKCCSAPDAVAVLKARAKFVGNKGRSRPFIQRYPVKYNKVKAEPVKTTYACHQCSASFVSRQALLSHSYLHDGLRPYQCSVCPAAYTSYSALSRHFNKHTDVQFICDHCSRSFKLKTALVAHMATHQPVKKHVCDECGKGFSQKAGMLLHVHRAHRHLPPPCACPICPKRFRRMSLLKIHMQEAHGMLLMTRKMFFRTLPTMTNDQLERAKVVFKSDVANCNDLFETQGHFATFVEDQPEIISGNTELAKSLEDHNYQLEFVQSLKDHHYEVPLAKSPAEHNQVELAQSAVEHEIEITDDNAVSSEEHSETVITEENATLTKVGLENKDCEDNFDSSEQYYYTNVGDNAESSAEDLPAEITLINSQELTDNKSAEKNAVTSEELVQYIEQEDQEGDTGDVKVVVQSYSVNAEDSKFIQANTTQTISTTPKYVEHVGRSKLSRVREEKPKESPVQLQEARQYVLKRTRQRKPTKYLSGGRTVKIIQSRTVRVMPKDGQNKTPQVTMNVTSQLASPKASQLTSPKASRTHHTAKTFPNETANVKITKAKKQEAPARPMLSLRSHKQENTFEFTVKATGTKSDVANTGTKRRSKPDEPKQLVDPESVIKRISSAVTVMRKNDNKIEVPPKKPKIGDNLNDVMDGRSLRGGLRNVRKGPSMPEF